MRYLEKSTLCMWERLRVVGVGVCQKARQEYGICKAKRQNHINQSRTNIHKYTSVTHPPSLCSAPGLALMQPILAKTTTLNSDWNSCHSVMTDSGDTFRCKAFSLKSSCSPQASPLQRLNVMRSRHELFPPSAQTGHFSFRTNTADGRTLD